MSAYLFSLLPDNAVLDWDAQADLLRFDDRAISAASLRIGASADGRSVVIEDGAGKTVTLRGVSLFELDASHLAFANGSRLVLPTIDNSYGFDLAGGSGADLLLGAAPGRALAGAATSSAGTATNSSASYASLSGDGRQVAFSSFGSNLVDSDANRATDIFVKDLATGQTTRASTSSTGVEANASSVDPTISLNGRYVVYTSSATNLVAGDGNGSGDIFVKDLLTGATMRASTDSDGAQATGPSSDASISGSGRFVVFTSDAADLVGTADTNGLVDIFLKDLQTGTTTLVSRTVAALGNGNSSNAVIAVDGRSVAFQSAASNLVSPDLNSAPDIFVRNLATGGLQRVSTDASGVEANGSSANPSLSADGRYVCFESSASNLVTGDTNGSTDVFVKDLVTGAVTRVSQRADGTQGNSFSGSAAISGDGRYVAFYSVAGNLVDGDHNGWYDVFVKDVQTGALSRLTVAPDGSGGTSTIMTFSWHPSFSADGSTITFTSPSRTLLPGDPTDAVTVYTVSNPLLGVTLAGGAGNDVYEIHRAGDAIVEAADGGVDTVRSSVSLALAANVENLELTGTASNDATGNAGNNVLAGNDGDNVLDGLGGVDTASFARASAGVVVDLDSTDAQDTGGAGIDTLRGIENLTGSAFGDTLLGNLGANTLDGGAGDDLMIGGDGNDVYAVDRAGDEVVEEPGSGIDTVRSSVGYTLGADLENLVLLGTANLNGTGNDGNNVLTGNRGNNVLDGGAGTDTASYATALAGVKVGLDRTGAQGTSGAGVDKLIGIENLTGGNFGDTLHGNAGANVLDGGAGADTLSYARAGAAVTVSLATSAAQATGGAGLDTVLRFENLSGSAFADDLTGNAGANVLDGGVGDDTMRGDAGDDTYVVQAASDLVVELAAGGTDTVRSGVTYTLAANVENLTLLGSANLNATGNAGNNVLSGNAGANILSGGSGADTASYVNAAAQVTVNLAVGLATGGGGTDSLVSIENVIGSAFGDVLAGSDAANGLTGGAGADVLTGGAGADLFVLDSPGGSDTITDFASGSDRLRIGQSGLRIGDGDTAIEGGVVPAGPDGFAPTAELVILTNDIAGAITAPSAAAAIGKATSAYAFGATALFVVDNGTDSAVWRFVSSGPDEFVSAGELTLLATLGGTGSTALGDYLFGG